MGVLYHKTHKKAIKNIVILCRMRYSCIDMTKVFTIGFSGKKPEVFLEILDAARIRCVWDIRLWRVSKYVPYYSGENLANVFGDRYEYHPEFAPTFEMLTSFKDKRTTWADAELIYRKMITERGPLANVIPDDLNHVCLLCTEKSADMCHRRLAAEYIASIIPDIEIIHL